MKQGIHVIAWLVACAATVSGVGVAQAGIPMPTAKGPIQSTATSYPLNSAAHEIEPEDLAAIGYVEEEYFVSGTANVYGEKEGRVFVEASGGAYKTRMLVRRPKDPSKFSGTVWVGPMNPSTNVDLVDLWMNARRYIVENKDVFVAYTAKPVAIRSLKKFDPDRYASLTMTNPRPDCQNPDAGTSFAAFSEPVPGQENGLVWDMTAQIGALLKSSSTPLTGFRAQYLYMTGGSQTGAFTIRFIESFHAATKLTNGKPVFDGYLPFVAAGPAPINGCTSYLSRMKPTAESSKGHSVPVIRIMSQTDFGGAPGGMGGASALAFRRADGDGADDKYRLYEIPGTSHMANFGLIALPSPGDFRRTGNAPFVYDCAEPLAIDGKMSAYIFDGAARNLDRWVRKGVLPPKASLIDVKAGVGVIDEYGNMRGGVRTPDVDVPYGTYFASSTATAERGAGGGCNAMGHIDMFSHEQLLKLYPTHADYVSKVDGVVTKMLAAGWLTNSDARQIKIDASEAPIPQ